MSYLKGSSMLVRNLTTQVIVDDTRNNSGDERLPFDLAFDVAREIHDAKELADIAIAYRSELSDFIVWLASEQRQYAIENSLCGNYERFLTFAVGGKRDECVSSNSIIRDDVEAFVVNATRPRRQRAMVLVPVAVEDFGITDGVDSYDVAYRMRNGESIGRIEYDGARVEHGSRSSDTLTYNEAQRVNENYHRRGTYGDDNGYSDESY